jgi:hypothetical protein
MVRRVLALLVLAGCTPTGEPTDEPTPPIEPDTRDLVLAPELRLREASCGQEYPSGRGITETPWIWDSTEAHDASNDCRLGCSIGAERTSWSFDGLTVSLLEDGDWVANSDERLGEWRTEVDGGDFVPTRVRWTTWCGPTRPVVFAAFDERRLVLVTLDRTTGELLGRVEEWHSDDRSDHPGIAAQMYCTEDGVQLHAKSDRGAWLSSYSTTSLERLEHREVPAALARAGMPADDHDGWVVLPHLPRGENRRDLFHLRDRERIDTPARRYDRVRFELFALDRAGDPLWHREAVHARPGCTTMHHSLVACSRCPNPSQHLSIFEDWVVLASYDIRSTVDVFDAEGAHVIHIAE